MQRDVLLLGEMVDAAEQIQVCLSKEQPSRLRNRIVHGYWTIDLEILHTTATDQLPSFVKGLRPQALAAVSD